jgi:hypothetical protein
MCGESDELSVFAGANWTNKYLELKAYKELHGQTLVDPETHKSLFNWSNAQRDAVTTMFINAKQKEALDKLGFIWTKQKIPKKAGSDGGFLTGLKCWSAKCVNHNKDSTPGNATALVAGSGIRV